MSRVQIAGEELLDYLTSNIHKSIFIVRNTDILAELRWEGDANKIKATSYIMITEEGRPTDLDITFNQVKGSDEYWQNSVEYYTTEGMDLMIDMWDKLGL